MTSHQSSRLRNLCIIAHVDHGKTTLVDHIMSQSGVKARHDEAQERVMDSDDQERERGITISAKNASFRLGDLKVNIVDTPGHADFGGEVERIMSMVDGGFLLVDAVEGPLPQTRFVLEKAVAQGLKIGVVINKVDRQEVQGTALIDDTTNKIFDLFVALGASDEQCDFPIVYACARKGWCTRDLSEVPALVSGEKKGNLEPLFEIIRALPSPRVSDDGSFSMLVSSLFYSEFLGPLAIGKVTAGSIKQNDRIERAGIDAKGEAVRQAFNVTKILGFDGLAQVEMPELSVGDIGLLAGCQNFEIGDTLCLQGGVAQKRIDVEQPTVRMIFSINTTPGSGKEGKAIQSRQLRERLIDETRHNVALKLEDTQQADQYFLLGRGELQFSIIIEKMRREGLEFMVGKPNVLIKTGENGKKLEPFERLSADVPESSASDVTSLYLGRKGQLSGYEALEGGEERVRLQVEIPTRGYLGTSSIFKTLTRGAGLISSEALGYRDHQGDIPHRLMGSLIADRTGRTTAYALSSVQERGLLFIGESVDVYEGMIVGECSRENDLNVNVCKPKKLTNIRTTASDGITILQGTKKMSLEQCLEWIDDDEWIEVTPATIRLRKKILAGGERSVRRADRVK